MNKGLRHILKIKKYKQRLYKLHIWDDSKGNYFAFRSHGKPCSCWACKDKKFNLNDRPKVKQATIKEINNLFGEIGCPICGETELDYKNDIGYYVCSGCGRFRNDIEDSLIVQNKDCSINLLY